MTKTGFVMCSNEIIFIDNDICEFEETIVETSESFVKRGRRKKNKSKIDERLQSLLNACDLYVAIRTIFSDADGNVFNIGGIRHRVLGLNEDLMALKEFWLYISAVPNCSFVYLETRGEVKYFFIEGALDTVLYSGLSNKCFGLQLVKNVGSIININILLFESLCSDSVSLIEARQRSTVLSHFYQIDLTVPEDISHSSLVDLEALYSSVKRQCQEICTNNVQHPNLVPKLRPYQKRAVAWMLQKETLLCAIETSHDFFIKFTAENNQVFYYNKYEGYLVLKEPSPQFFPKGGILADEMGLGKTVEVLALILLNSASDLNISKSCLLISDKCAKIFEPKPSALKGSSSNEETSSDKDFDERVVFPKNVDSTSRKTNSKRKCTEIRRKTNVSKKRSKSETFQALQQWYNKILSETSTQGKSTRTVQNQVLLIPGLQCVCGQDNNTLSQIQCCTCFNWQHVQCVGNPNPGGYNCPQCWKNMDPIHSRATLIVSPTSISNQWFLEIEKHINDGNFKTLVYRGVQKDGFLQPHFLADFHIVITTYEILRKELVHADVNSADQPRSLRFSKRFCAVPSPLLFIKWWRVCLDEAQMVEGSTSKTAEMTRRLDAVHRWAITGTPVQKTVQDLFGLIQFLGVEPYNDQRYWSRCLHIPFLQGNTRPLHQLLDLIMWRTVKSDVLHEINIPEQTHEFHWLSFSPIEEHFYRLQHTLCSYDFILMCSKFEEINVPLKMLNRSILHRLLKPLLRLRQACSHHHVVRGFLVGQKATMTMDELLESLLKKTKLEAEEALRRSIAAINGLAGIHIIKELWTEAVECYREVLSLSELYKDSLKMDTLQKIHTLHNLAEVLCTHSESIPPTLRDHKLQQEATELEEKFMNKEDDKVATAQDALSNLTSHISDLLSTFSVGRDEWWTELLIWLMSNDEKNEFLSRMHFELLENQIHGQSSIINRVKTLPSVTHQLAIWSDDLFKNRKDALNKLQHLNNASLLDLANQAVECHLRTNIITNAKKKCQLCEIELFLKEYESLLFAVSNKQTQHSFVGEVMIMNNLNQGTWKPSEHERILRVLLSFSRSKRASVELLEDGGQFQKVLDAMKKEFKQIRYTWTRIRDRVSVQDELHMAKLRLRVRFEDEQIPQSKKKHNPLHQLSSLLTNKLETIHVIELHEVESHAAGFHSDRVQSEVELRRKMGQLQYLKNLGKNQGCKKNPDPCPICRTELGEKWSVLQCGHCFCVDCIQQLMQSIVLRTIGNVKCPVCRDVTLSCDLSFVDIGSKSQVEDKWPDTSVCGSFSTKIEAVVRCLLSIRKSQHDVKALVFSTWDKVLDVLEKALIMNDLSFCRLQSGSKYKGSLQLFKEESRNITALLIPISLGAKGLNLIEATHVLLVDPMLNMADELQAIGRVHRIGQTKKTTVHHFYISGTIEERIYEATRANEEKWRDNSITVQQLKALFNNQSDFSSETNTDEIMNNS